MLVSWKLRRMHFVVVGGDDCVLLQDNLSSVKQ
jgi:hypothetical protein